MIPTELEELEKWAQKASIYSPHAAIALVLIHEYRRVQSLNLAQAERIAAQSELLSKRSEAAK